MYLHNDVITEERISFLRKNREEKREEHFKKLIPAMGEAAVDEVRKIYSMFDERMLIWYAGLWEPEIGGFYFSNSARDHEGFLPDLESTYQAVSFIATQCGFVFDTDNAITVIPERFARKISDFAYSTQDEDGWFYHKQWGKNITQTRRGRDAAAAWRLIEPLGRECKYVRAVKRQAPVEKEKTLPEHLRSMEAFREWLDSKDISTRSYPFGNFINSTVSEIRQAGDEFVKELIKWLNSKQYPENGLWEPEVTYDSVSGLMKLGLCYPGFGATLPYSERSFESARSAIISSEPVEYSCQFYNAWAALGATLVSMENEGKGERAEEYRRKLRENAAEMIRITGEKMALAQVSDGSFAYFTSTSGKACPTSQMARVALDHIREGDINGNGCSTKAPLTHMFKAFGVEMPPMFCREDAEFLFELMDDRIPVEKKPQPNL